MLTQTTAADGATQIETAPSAPKKRFAATQSRSLKTRLVTAGELFAKLDADPSLVEFVAGFGYNAAALQHGAELYRAAHSQYVSRQTALATLHRTQDAMHRAHGETLLDYRRLRNTARIIFDNDDHIALAIDDRFPTDLDSLLQVARTFYEAALANPNYVAAFEANGVTEEYIHLAAANLEALVTANVELQVARAEARHALRTRDDSAKGLRQWMMRFRGMARIATRQRPDLAAILDV